MLNDILTHFDTEEGGSTFGAIQRKTYNVMSRSKRPKLKIRLMIEELALCYRGDTPLTVTSAFIAAVAIVALLEVGTTQISAVLPLDMHLSQTNTSCVPKCCYQSV
jgi:hypothetical protein